MPGEPVMLSVRARVDGNTHPGPRLDLEFETAATITALMGPSGAGKTTLLQAIAGLVHPSRGRIVLGRETLFDSELRINVPTFRRRIALVFQSLALLPHLSVWQNVAYGLPARARGRRRETAMTWLERARVATLADRAPSTLSGGEAQRVALARALASEPRLLLLDEPFSALNQELRIELCEILQELLAAMPVPVLFVTHDLADAERIASRILVLDQGQIAADKRLPGHGAESFVAGQ